MPTQRYRLGPATVEVDYVNAQQQGYLDVLWQQLFQLDPSSADTVPLVCLHWMGETAAMPSLPMQELFRYGAIRVGKSVAAFTLHCGESWLTLNVAQGEATGYLAADFACFSLAEQREFFQLLFFLLLRRQGYYILHANAVLPPSRQGIDLQAGMLLVGDCGAGKTTLTLSLLQAGWRCVGDDLAILAEEEGMVMAYGLRRGFSCTPQTAAAFPTLQAQLAEGPDLLRNKKFVQVESIYPTQFIPRCTPRLLIFPRIAPQPHSEMIPMTATEAMRRLLSQPRAGILVDPPSVAGHLRIYGKLVGQAASGEFLSGQDVLTAPDTVGQLLAHVYQSD
jgi:hypothetical protein